MNLQEILDLKQEVVADLYQQGKISRAECFKHEVAVSVQHDPGPIKLLTKEQEMERV